MYTKTIGKAPMYVYYDYYIVYTVSGDGNFGEIPLVDGLLCHSV